MAVGGRRPSKADTQTIRFLQVQKVETGQEGTSPGSYRNFFMSLLVARNRLVSDVEASFA